MKGKLIRGLLSLTIAASMLPLGGCGKKEGEKTDTLSITVYNPIFSKSPVGTAAQDKWQQMMEEYLGVKLNIKWDELSYGDYISKIKTYVAAGDYADVFLCTDLDSIQQLGESGQILNLSDYEEYMPNYKKFLDEKWQKEKVSTRDGNIYAFMGATQGSHNGNQSVNAIRFDIFEKNGISVPGTLEEYYEAAKKLKAIYPDSYPISCMGGLTSALNTFLNINHVDRSIMWDGEKYIYPLIDKQERFKEVVEYMKKLYDEGLLDPEFMTQSSDQLMQKMLSGKNFMVNSFMAIRINQYLNNNEEYNVRWGVIPELKNSHGETPWIVGPCTKGKKLSEYNGTVINSKVKNPEMVVKLLDYQYSDEMIELNNWGIEGVTFSKDENGNNKYTDEILKAENSQTKLAEYGVGSSMSVRCGIQFMPQDFDSYLSLYKDVPVYKDGKEYEDNWYHFINNSYGDEKISPNINKPPVVLDSSDRYEYNAILNSLASYMEENVSKFIVGQRDISEWNSFISEIKTVGDYQKVVNVYNDAVNSLK